jgi:prevent-host-death family protein
MTKNNHPAGRRRTKSARRSPSRKKRETSKSIAQVGKPSDARQTRKASRSAIAGRWVLHEAKARFSELVRKASTDGPQRVSVHGRDQVVVMSAEAYERLKGERPGRLLVDVLRKSPLRGIDIEPASERSPVRDVEL